MDNLKTKTVRCTCDYYFREQVRNLKSDGWKQVSPIKYGWGEYSVTMQKEK